MGKIYTAPSSVPTPEVFFPLTDGGNETTLASWPSSEYEGNCTSSAEKSWQGYRTLALPRLRASVHLQPASAGTSAVERCTLRKHICNALSSIVDQITLRIMGLEVKRLA